MRVVTHTHVCLCVVRGFQGDLWNRNMHLCFCVYFIFTFPQISFSSYPKSQENSCLTILEILCYMPHHRKKLMLSNSAPFQIPREEKLIGPAGVHCTHLSSNHLWPRKQQPTVQTWAYSCHPEDGDKGGGLKAWEKRSVSVWRHPRYHSTLHSRAERGLMHFRIIFNNQGHTLEDFLHIPQSSQKLNLARRVLLCIPNVADTDGCPSNSLFLLLN